MHSCCLCRIQNWLFGCQLLLKYLTVAITEEKASYYTNGAPFAKWFWSLWSLRLCTHQWSSQRGEVWGQSSLGANVGMVHWICWHLLPIFSPGWGIGLLLQFYSRISEEKTPAGICYAPSRNGWERDNERSIENVVLSHSLTYKESSTSSLAVDKCRPRPDFVLFLRPSKLWFVWILIQFDSWANCKIN